MRLNQLCKSFPFCVFQQCAALRVAFLLWGWSWSFRIAAKTCEQRLRLIGEKSGNPGKYPGFPEVVSHHVVRKSGISVEKAAPHTLSFLQSSPLFLAGCELSHCCAGELICTFLYPPGGRGVGRFLPPAARNSSLIRSLASGGEMICKDRWWSFGWPKGVRPLHNAGNADSMSFFDSRYTFHLLSIFGSILCQPV